MSEVGNIIELPEEFIDVSITQYASAEPLKTPRLYSDVHVDFSLGKTCLGIILVNFAEISYYQPVSHFWVETF